MNNIFKLIKVNYYLFSWIISNFGIASAVVVLLHASCRGKSSSGGISKCDP